MESTGQTSGGIAPSSSLTSIDHLWQSSITIISLVSQSTFVKDTIRNVREGGSAGLYTVYILFLWSLNAKLQIPSLRRRVFALEMLDLWKCTNTRALMSVLMTLRPPCWPVLQSPVSADTTLTYSLQPYLIQLFHKTLENILQMFLLRQATVWLQNRGRIFIFYTHFSRWCQGWEGRCTFYTLEKCIFWNFEKCI